MECGSQRSGKSAILGQNYSRGIENNRTQYHMQQNDDVGERGEAHGHNAHDDLAC